LEFQEFSLDLFSMFVAKAVAFISWWYLLVRSIFT